MSGRDLRWRLAGILVLAGAGGLGLAHHGAPAGPAAVYATSLSLGLVLALTGFVLACLGMLLIIQGSRLRDGWVSACARAERDRAARRKSGPARKVAASEIDPVLLGDPGLGGRLALTTFLILRAQQQSEKKPRNPAKPKRDRPFGRPPHLQRESH